MVAVEIVDDPRRLTGRDPVGPVGCFVSGSDQPSLERALQAVGIHSVPQEWSDRHEGWSGVHARYTRPDIREIDGRIVAELFGVTDGYRPEPWTLVAAEQVLVVVGEGPSGHRIRLAVQHCDTDDARTALVAAVLGLARAANETLERIVAETVERDGASTGFSRADERSELRELRGKLFTLQELFAAQSRLMDDDEFLAGIDDRDEARQLRRAGSVFDYGRGFCARLYALAGDQMSEQNSLVNERLTLVSTFFLPLTVSTGFFGMNFGWMTDRVGGAAAFLVLGVCGPALSTLVTLVAVRRMGASGR